MNPVKFVVEDGTGKVNVSISDVPAIPLGGSSLPIEVTLDRPAAKPFYL